MKREIVSILVVVLFFGLAIAPSINAVENKSHAALGNDGNLSGYVYDININPIEGALVRVYFHGESEEDYTDSSGYYHVTNIPICNCTKNVTASKGGYFTEQVLLSIYENTTYDFILMSIDPVPDLDCSGELDFVDVEPGATVTGTCTVENIGEVDSLLDWEIESYPDWGTWTFDPDNGVDLLAGDTETVDVEIVCPENLDNITGGEVIIVNSENPDDICIIDVIFHPPHPPPSYPITLIGKISNLEVHNESISFHADFVIIIFIIIPVGSSINEDMTIGNDYRGFVGDRFICAFFWT